jgi:ABC-2 type transport system permease protein
VNAIGFRTLFYKEVLRFLKVWLQTVMAPVVAGILFLLVFGQVAGTRAEPLAGVSYVAFLVPGLMMMLLIQNAFANTSSSLIQSKVAGNIVFLLLAPLSYFEFFAAFVAAAVVRGLLVGAGVYAAVAWAAPVPVQHIGVILLFATLGSAVLGALGMIAGIWAQKFDQLAGFQNFIILPLSFLSGVFYSLQGLPPFWRALSHLNPFFFMVDGFRYGFFGVSDVSPWLSFAVVLATLVVVSVLTLWILRIGYKLRD